MMPKEVQDELRQATRHRWDAEGFVAFRKWVVGRDVAHINSVTCGGFEPDEFRLGASVVFLSHELHAHLKAAGVPSIPWGERN